VVCATEPHSAQLLSVVLNFEAGFKIGQSQRKGNCDYFGVVNWQNLLQCFQLDPSLVRELVLVALASTKRVIALQVP